MNDQPLPALTPWDIQLQKEARTRTKKRFRLFVQFLLLMSVALFAAIIVSAIAYKILFSQSIKVSDLGLLILYVNANIFVSLISSVLAFWPFIFLFYGLFQTFRRQTLTTLVQNCMKSKASLPSTIRAYAATLSFSYYKMRLENFALSLESGMPFQKAVATFPYLFTTEIVQLIHLHGDSPETLDLISQNLSNERNRSCFQVSSLFRFIYIMIICWQFLAIVLFVSVMVVPQFIDILVDFDILGYISTPNSVTVTDCFFSFFRMISSFGILPFLNFLFFFISVLYIVFLFMKFDLWRLRPPFLRRFFRYSDSAQLLRFLGLGVQKGISFSRCLDVYQQSLQSSYLKMQIDKIRKTIESGASWIDGLLKQQIIDRNEAALLETSFRAQNGDAVLNELGILKEAKQNRADDINSKLLFVFMLFLMGIIVAFFAVAMFAPLVHLTFNLS